MREPDIDLSLYGGLYEGLGDAIVNKKIEGFVTKAEAQKRAVEMGWGGDAVLNVARRFERLWHVGRKFDHDEDGKPYYLYKFPTGQYVNNAMVVLDVKCDVAELEKAMKKTKKEELVERLVECAKGRCAGKDGWSDRGDKWRACDDELKGMIDRVSYNPREWFRSKAIQVVDEKGAQRIRELFGAMDARLARENGR